MIIGRKDETMKSHLKEETHDAVLPPPPPPSIEYDQMAGVTANSWASGSSSALDATQRMPPKPPSPPKRSPSARSLDLHDEQEPQATEHKGKGLF